MAAAPAPGPAPAEDEHLGFLAADAPSGALAAAPAAGTLGTIEPTTWRNFICRSSHPIAAFHHLAFKAAAFVVYCFSDWFGLDFVTTFVSVMLLLAADFYVVKNITGRLMVGLRWWSRVKNESGETEWFFESSPTAQTVPALDNRIFWWALYAAPLVWGACALGAVLTLSVTWLLLHCVAVGLTGANLVGYIRCSTEARKRLQSSLAIGAAAAGAISALGALAPGAAAGTAGAGGAAGTAGAAGGVASGVAGAVGIFGRALSSVLGAAANSQMLAGPQPAGAATAAGSGRGTPRAGFPAV